MALIKIQGKTILEGKTIFSGAGYSVQDTDAAAYIESVESADGSFLEDPVKQAIDAFVLGCKSDSIWSDLKAACILAGAKTLAGALVPLVGSSPTNNNFVSGDYNRETGLKGNKSTKYLNTNRNNNADPQNDQHMSVYVSQLGTSFPASYIGAGAPTSVGATHFGDDSRYNSVFVRSQTSTGAQHPTATRSDSVPGHIGLSRASGSSYVYRADGVSATITQASQSPYNANISVFTRTDGTGICDVRLSFYSIGEATDLAKLDSRVSTLMTDIAAAI